MLKRIIEQEIPTRARRMLARLGVMAAGLALAAVAPAQETVVTPMTDADLLRQLDTPQEPTAPTPSPTRDPFATTDSGYVLEGGFFTQNNIAYGVGRTTITFGDLSVSADRVALDVITQIVEAEGDVVLLGREGRNEEVRATSLRYDFRRQEGVAYGVEGVAGRVFFRTMKDEEAEGPAFRRISEDEAIFRDASYTTSGFPVPTWYMKADEIVLIPGERWFMRGATLYVRNVPVFYFPFFTASFDQSSPWSFELGFLSRYGGYARIGYQFDHETLVPDWEDPSKTVTRSEGRLGVRADIFTGGAAGFGVDYRYRFDFDRHIGSLSLYGVRDTVRDVPDEDSDGFNRYIYRHRHNTLFENTIFQLNADWMSDPDLYYDLVDPFEADSRGRMPERRFRTAVTYFERDFLARFSVDLRDRVTRNRYQDFTEIQDDDLNYDPDPDFEARRGRRFTGINNNRYGRVSERYEGRVATRMLPFFRTPLYWNAQANAFHNRDAGFNEGSERDDAWMRGADAYGALTNRIRLDGQGRFTWINSVGVGAGYYDRDTNRLIARRDAPPGLGSGAIVNVDGQRYADERTVLLGDSGRRVSYSDVTPLYLWADYRSRLNARFTENLSGYLQYTLRKGTQDSVGEFYRQTGQTEKFEDLYDFPVDRHTIEAFLEYHPLFPRISTYVGGGVNLMSRSDIFANEQRYFLTTGANYENDSGEWRVNTSITYDARQARDRADSNSFTYEEIRGLISTTYVPRHGRWWAGLDIGGNVPLSDDPVSEPPRKRARFTENSSDVNIRPRIGRQFGPKYEVEVYTDYSTRLQDFREGGVIIRRDLYDADLTLAAGFRTTTFRNRDRDDDTSRGRPSTDKELNVRVGLAFKVPEERAGLGAVSIQTLKDQQLSPTFVE